MNTMTAAHRTLPFDTVVKVSNLSNGKAVTVRINDRGPFVKDRIIDLSYIAAKQIDMLGKVITDSRGMTLYRFDRDTPNPPESNCYGPCVGLWPPVTGTADKVQAVGIDKALIGTITRKDGATQLTINGWPLYHYAKDTAPGEARGQAVGNTWYAATPQGSKAAAAQDSGYGSGY